MASQTMHRSYNLVQEVYENRTLGFACPDFDSIMPKKHERGFLQALASGAILDS